MRQGPPPLCNTLGSPTAASVHRGAAAVNFRSMFGTPRPQLASLILRLTVGGLMLPHGLSKLTKGVAGIQSQLSSVGLPEFVAYGALVGEILAPLGLILGVFTRLSAATVAFTMTMAIFLVHRQEIFSLRPTGALAIELPLLFLLASVVIFLNGPDRYALGHRIGRIRA